MLHPRGPTLKKNLFDDIDLAPEKLEKYRSSKPLLLKDASKGLQSVSKLKTPLKSTTKELSSYSPEELEEILTKVIHKNPYLAKDNFSAPVPFKITPPYKTGTLSNSNQCEKRQKVIEKSNEEPGNIELDRKSFEKSFDFNNYTNEKELNNLKEDLSDTEDGEFELILDANPYSRQIDNSLIQPEQSPILAPATEDFRVRFNHISEQIQLIKKDRSSLKEKFCQHKNAIRQSTCSLSESLETFKQRTRRITRLQSRKGLKKIIKEVASIKSVLHELKNEVPDFLKTTKISLEELVSEECQRKLNKPESTEDEEEKDLEVVDDITKWVEKEQNLTRLASQESNSSGKKSRARGKNLRRETENLSQEELKKDCTKKATELLIEGLQHLIKMTPALAEDENQLRSMIKNIRDGKSIDVSELLQKKEIEAMRSHLPLALEVKVEKRMRIRTENEPEVNAMRTADKNVYSRFSPGDKPGNNTPKSSAKKAKN